ncbi:MAG TPA: Ig-like domain-containing protein [Candidatus Dormibacteraeota bacterium]|nr:Ig-like domain-containing protein [Candidatus Dormibacteraeota bacterium]
MRTTADPRARLVRLTLAVSAACLVASCGGGGASGGAGAMQTGGGATAPSGPAPAGAPPTLTVSPSDGTQSVPLDARVAVTTSGGSIDSVTVHRSGDATSLAGSVDASGTWSLTGQLAPSTQYVVVAAAHDAGGATTLQASFTTATPKQTAATKVYPYDGMTVGVGMPAVLVFDHAVAADRQADVTDHVQVHTSVPVAGAWRWFTPQEAHWRPQDFWPEQTRVTVTAALSTVSIGNGRYGTDFTSTFTIGQKHVSTVDAATHQMTVTADDQVVHTYPVSTGRDTGSPTINGTLFVWYKLQSVRMVSTSVGIPVNAPGGYDEIVYWDTSISSDGYYIHAAPWSVTSQGRQNVSHGCVNLSTDRAIEFFKFSQVGDVVVVQNTGKTATYADGEADWQIPFAQYAASGVAGYPQGGSSFPGGL